MINKILLTAILVEFSLIIFFLIKYSLVFFKLIKKRDGYYLIKGVF